MSVAVVTNPTKMADGQEEALRAVAREHGVDLLWLETTQDDPGAGMARQALEHQVELVAVLGGDGTVRNVAGVLAHSGVSLALLGGGTGNLLARNLDVPFSDPVEAFRIALEAPDRAVDLAWVKLDDEPETAFAVMCGMGMDAEVMDETSEQVKAKVGWFGYGLTAVKKLAGRAIHVWVRTDDTSFDQHVRTVLVGNCGSIQGGIQLMPQAELDDGRLDLLAVAPVGPVGWAAAAWGIITRRRHGHHILRDADGTTITVRTRRPTAVEVDGDPIGRYRQMSCRVDQQALVVRNGNA